MYETRQNDWILLITQEENEQRADHDAITRAGWPDECILTANAEEAVGFLSQRLQNHTERPGIIVVDLDDTTGENRERLKSLMRSFKSRETHLRTIPLIMLVRDNAREDTDDWYRAGVNAVALRSRDFESAVVFFRSLRTFWRERVTLPDADWPSYNR